MGLAQSSPNYQLDLTVDYDTGVFDGTAIITVTNSTGVPLSELFFRLYANDDSLYGMAFIQIHDVSIQTSSRTFSLYLDDTVVLVPLDEPLQPDEAIEVAIEFTGGTSLWPANQRAGSADTGYGLLTKSSSVLTLTAFYPILAVYSQEEGWALDPSTGFGDTLMGDCANYTVTLTTRAGPLPVTSGVLVAVNPETHAVTYDFAATQARDFSLALVDPSYVSQTSESEYGTIRTWFSASSQSAGILASDMAMTSLELYTHLVGPCLFREIDLVEVPLRNAAGVEFSGLILVGSQYTADPTDLFFSIIISHEMAHQWFYAGVGNDVSEHPWLDESFATYLSYEFLSTYYGGTTARSQLESWHSVYDQAEANWSELSIGSPRYAFPNSSVYSSFVYSGGSLFLYDLKQTVGDDAFYRGLRSYYEEMRCAFSLPQDFIRIIRETCSCSIDELLTKYRFTP